MKLLRSWLVVGLVASSLTAMGGATAHPRDEMRPSKAGPIHREETTMSELREWFGTPNSRRVVMVACIRVIRARWDGLQVYAYRNDDRAVGCHLRAKPSYRELRARGAPNSYREGITRG